MVPDAAPAIVLDTNTVLDLWLFRDPDTAISALRQDLQAGGLRWLACEAMRAELAAVLARGVGAARGVTAQEVLQHWDLHVQHPLAAPPCGQPSIRCRDTDDQVFIDLALELGAKWLLTSDKDLLSLRRRAAARGLQIATPRQWAAISPSSPAVHA